MNWKYAALPALTLGLMFVSCTNTLTQTPTTNEVSSTAVDKAHQACTQDTDCVVVMTHCSCHCGEAIHTSHAKSYEDKRDALCEDYSGRKCKTRCEGEPRCQDSVCTIVDP